MPEVLGNPPSPRTALFWNGTAWQWALVDAAGHLQIDAASLLGLEGALQSVATDRLIVRGEDQLFSIKSVLAIETAGVVSGADGWFESGSCPADELWDVTTITVYDGVSPLTRVELMNRHDGANICIDHLVRAFVVGERHVWGGHTYLDGGDVIRAYLTGSLVGDTCEIELTGYRMTVET